MPRYCSFQNCKSNSRNNPKLSFFRFPKEKERCNLWIMNSGRPDIQNKESSYCYRNLTLCSKHFEKRMFSSLLFNKLKLDAVPIFFDLPTTSTVADVEDRLLEIPKTIPPIETKDEYSASLPTTLPDVSTSTTSDISLDSPSSSTSFDSSTQTPHHLSDGSPRKLRLRKRVRLLQRREQRIQGKKLLDFSKEVTQQDITQFIYKHFEKEIANFIKLQLDLIKTKPKGSRYSSEILKFAFNIYFLSPLAYRYLCKIFRLPSKATLMRVARKWPVLPGVNDFVLEVIKSKVNKFSPKARDCIICVDEISLKSNLFYNRTKDEIVGFHDVNNSKTFAPANSAFVVMARGIHIKWKQPVLYFFVNNTCSGNDLKGILNKSINKCQEIGLNVLAVVSDQGSNFYNFCKKNITIEQPYFFVNEKKIYYLFDVPHLMKSLRNNFFNYYFHTSTGVTNKQYLVMFYKADSQLPLRLAPKLTEQHLNPGSFDKMRVKFAVQIFSATVAAALNTYISLNALPTSAHATVECIDKIDKLFDLFNSSYITGAKKYNLPFKGEQYQIDFLNEMVIFFQSLRITNKENADITNRMKFIYGWQVTISAFLQLWDDLKGKGVSILFTRRINQDALENLFGKIRQQGGNSINPTPMQFSKAFKKLFCMDYFSVSEGTNCVNDFDEVVTSMSTTDEIQNFNTVIVTPKQTIFKNLQIDSYDYHSLKFPERNALSYVAGYFIKKCFTKHKCEMCIKFAKTNPDISADTLYNYFRAYQNESKDTFGNLNMPPTTFYEYLTKLEYQFCQLFPLFSLNTNVGVRIRDQLKSIEYNFPCDKFPKEYFLNLFVRVRIFYTLKFANRKFKEQSGNKKNRKLIILQHM